MELFLVQVDLQMIKEIIDRFTESEFTLKDIVRARSKTRDVDEAITYLEHKAAKRRKLEEPRGGDVPCHQHTKSTHTGRIEKLNNVHCDSTPSDAEASADQTTSRKPKRSMLSKGKDDVAVDTDDSLSGSTISKRTPSGGAPSSGNSGVCYYPSLDIQQFRQVTDQDLYGVSPERSQSSGVTQQSFDARHRTVPQAGLSYASEQLNYNPRYSTISVPGSRVEVNHYNQDRYGTFPQTGPPSVNTEGRQTYHRVPHAGRPLNPDGTKERMDSATANSHSVSHHETVAPLHPTVQYFSERYAGSDTRGHAVFTQSITAHPTNEVISDTNDNRSKSSSRTETRVSASGDARYANVQDISSNSDQKLGSSESDKRMSTKESARRHDDRDVKYGPAGTSSSEPMEVGQTEYSRDGRNDATLHNGMVEGVYARPTGQSGITDLNATLSHQLSLEPSVHQAGKEAKQIIKVFSEHRRQHGSESVARAQAATGSRGETTGGAQPPRFFSQTRTNLTSETAEKSEVQGSLPVPSWRTSAQRERAQNPAHSTRNERDTEVSHKGKAPQTDVKRDDDAKCDQCLLQGTISCIHCHKIICRNCRKIYVTDLCDAAKGGHVFTDLKDNKQQHTNSVDSRASSTQPHANMNEGSVNDGNNWSCSRCTFLNPPGLKICAMCSTTRGVGPVELTQPGSRVCRNCTYHNKENATVCRSCHKTLDLHPSETSV